jgi:hypothetical protein
MSKSSFFYHTPHLKGEEDFGFAKQPIDCPLGANNDYHHPDRVNFSHPQAMVLAIQPNVIGNIGM